MKIHLLHALSSGLLMAFTAQTSMRRTGILVALVLYCATASSVFAQQGTLDQYLEEIEILIAADDLEGARDKLAEAAAANLRDESLEMAHTRLRLLESLNESNAPDSPTSADNRLLTDLDMLAAIDMLDSLRVAIENGELDKVKNFSDTTPATESLLNAIFANYSAVQIEVSRPEADQATKTFLATLSFKELKTKNGDIAYPADAWKSHQLRVIRSNGGWQKVQW